MAEADHSYTPATEHITIPASELGAPIATNLPCPHAKCGKVFKQSSALRFHVERTHKIKDALQTGSTANDPKGDKSTIVHYHCPEEKCIYHANGEGQRKHFTHRKYLRTHFLRVHAEKAFTCKSCRKSFSIENDLRYHQAECGHTYQCSECVSCLDTWKAYSAHCTRFKHPLQVSLKPVLEDARFKQVPTTNMDNNEDDSSSTKSDKSTRSNKATPSNSKSGLSALKHILPNPSTMILSLDVIMPSEGETARDEDSQTTSLTTLVPKSVIYMSDTTPKQTPYVPKIRSKSSKASTAQRKHIETNTEAALGTPCESCSRACGCERENQVACQTKSPRFTASTQTGVDRGSRIETQTQTTGDFILKKAMLSANIPMERESRGSQVSPRAKLKRSHTNLQTIHTQTMQPPKKRRRKKHVQDISTTTMDTIPEGYTLSIPDNPWSSVADTQTQTLVLLDELQASLGESISTQTLESYLHDTSSQDSAGLDLPTMGSADRTVDQAVLCDLGLLSASSLPVSAQSETNPRALITSSLQVMSAASTIDAVSSMETQTSFMRFNDSSNARQTTLANLNDSRKQVTFSNFNDSNTGTQTTFTNLEDSNSGAQATFTNFDDSNSQTQTNFRNLDNTVISTQTSFTNFGTNTQTNFTTMDDSHTSTQATFTNMDDSATGTQTTFTDFDDSHIGTQTTFPDLDFPELLTSAVQTSDFHTSYMNIETQTIQEDRPRDSVLDQLLSNMHTQTTDDFLADLSFSDIETQTSSGPLSALERQTIETQTSLHTLAPQHPTASSTDSQTQTLFIPAAICPDLADSYTQTAFTELETLMDHLNR